MDTGDCITDLATGDALAAIAGGVHRMVAPRPTNLVRDSIGQVGTGSSTWQLTDPLVGRCTGHQRLSGVAAGALRLVLRFDAADRDEGRLR
jgi:hypothetical protein